MYKLCVFVGFHSVLGGLKTSGLTAFCSSFPFYHFVEFVAFAAPLLSEAEVKNQLDMAAQTTFSVEMFPVGVSMMDEGRNLSDVPRDALPAPQLVMLANVAAVTAAEGGGGCENGAGDEKEMMELKTVGSSYSDSEDENVIRSESATTSK